MTVRDVNVQLTEMYVYVYIYTHVLLQAWLYANEHLALPFIFGFASKGIARPEINGRREDMHVQLADSQDAVLFVCMFVPVCIYTHIYTYVVACTHV